MTSNKEAKWWTMSDAFIVYGIGNPNCREMKENTINSYLRLEELQKNTDKSECLAFSFARELLPSATEAYGRPVIDSHEEEGPRSITFEWQNMFWLFQNNGKQMTVVIDDPKEALTFYRDEFKSFVNDHTDIPYGMPPIGNQSEFKNI